MCRNERDPCKIVSQCPSYRLIPEFFSQFMDPGAQYFCSLLSLASWRCFYSCLQDVCSSFMVSYWDMAVSSEKEGCFYFYVSFISEATLIDLPTCSLVRVGHTFMPNQWILRGMRPNITLPLYFLFWAMWGWIFRQMEFCSKEIVRWGNQLKLPGFRIPGTFLLLCYSNFKHFFCSTEMESGLSPPHRITEYEQLQSLYILGKP